VSFRKTKTLINSLQKAIRPPKSTTFFCADCRR